MISAGGSSASARTEPWQAQQPYLEELYARAGELSNQQQAFYPGSTVVPFSREREESMAGTSEMARRGSEDVRASQGYNRAIMGGAGLGFLDPNTNPWLQGLYDTSARSVTRAYQTAVEPGTESRFQAAGRGGSGAAVAAHERDQDILGRNLNELATQIYAPAYQQAYGLERGAQEAAAGRAFQYPEYAYSEMDRLGGVGQMREQQSGQYLQELMDRFYYPRQEEASRLAEYQQAIGPPVSTSRQKSSSFNAELFWCSRKLKDVGEEVALDELLEAVGELPIHHWNYKWPMAEEPEETPHVGPMAEDFHRLFGLGDGEKINSLDAVGVLFGAVVALTKKLQQLESELGRRAA
jgi:hypothetical protein